MSPVEVILVFKRFYFSPQTTLLATNVYQAESKNNVVSEQEGFYFFFSEVVSSGLTHAHVSICSNSFQDLSLNLFLKSSSHCHRSDAGGETMILYQAEYQNNKVVFLSRESEVLKLDGNEKKIFQLFPE